MGRMLDAWATVLDRSFEQLGEASADARTFDRRLIAEVSDAWDNNMYPFVAAATARRRETSARASLWWMADFGVRRYQWLLEQAAAGGCPIDLPPVTDAGGIRRDYAGRVRHRPEALTTAMVAALAVDYDLATARPKHLLAEWSDGRLEGRLLVEVERRFAVDADYPAAELDLWFTDLDALRFDLDDAEGVAFEGAASVVIGDRGILRASSGTVQVDDSAWHQSAAGRIADSVTPAEIVRPRDHPDHRLRGSRGRVRGAALGAAHLLHAVMIEIRMVRYPSWAHRIAVHQLAQTFAGAGTAVVEAGAALRRDAAFQRLIDRWKEKAGPGLASWFESALADGWPGVYEPGDNPLPTGESQLLLAGYSAASPPHPARVVLQFASPGDPWLRCGVEVEEPDRFGVRLEAFGAPLGAAMRADALALSGLGGM